MTAKEAIELIETGDFTIAYHGRGQAYLYKGHYEDYDDLPEKEDYVFGSDRDGYIPSVVHALVKAAGGKALTI